MKGEGEAERQGDGDGQVEREGKSDAHGRVPRVEESQRF